MYCHGCGGDISETAKFCQHCGVPVSVVEPVSTKPTEAGPRFTKQTVERYAKAAATEVVGAGRSAIKSKLGKEMAVGAAAGAVIALPIPFVGPLTGAAIGAGIVAYKRFWKA